jgi:integrase
METRSVGGPRNVTRQFRALLRAAPLPLIRLRDLRHSCATLLLAQAVAHAECIQPCSALLLSDLAQAAERA